MQIPILKDLTIIFILSLAVLFISHKVKLPAIVGYLITGIIVGPTGFGLIEKVHEVEVLAEIGVVLLLFTIGLEFSFKELSRLKKAVFLGGSSQVVFTVVSVYMLGVLFEAPPRPALFYGFLVSLSSTAIVLKAFQQRAEVDSPHGRNALAILIFQDIIVVPMMLVTPFLVETRFQASPALFFNLSKGLFTVGLVIVSARYLVPKLLFQVSRTRNWDLFLLSICGMGLGIAWITSEAGLSLGLGAFLAGLII